MAAIDGARLVARCLKQQGIDELFGVVGIPVTGIAAAAPSEGLRYIGTRHEQAAGYAAQAISYLKGRVGACIVVSGPGMTNAISALGNAWARAEEQVRRFIEETQMPFLIGARLNWIMHFGLPPRFRKDLRVVQLDIAAEEIGTNVPTEVPLVGETPGPS